MPHPRSDRALIARIGAAHGIKVEVRVKAYTAEPGGIAAYGPLDAPDGRTFEVAALRAAAGPASDMLVVRFKGVADRSAGPDTSTASPAQAGRSRNRRRTPARSTR